MPAIIDAKMKEFMRVKDFEEAVDQPLYHFQSYGTSGATQFSFFNTAVGNATNLLSDTNMDTASQLSIGKRMAVFDISVVFIPGQAPEVAQTTTANILPSNNGWTDAKAVLDGIGYVQATLLEKVYLNAAPLSYLPAGFGTYAFPGGIANNQTTAANASFIAAGAVNGFPAPISRYKLKVPWAIPSQMRFGVTLNFASAITVGTAARIGVILGGVQIRAKQ